MNNHNQAQAFERKRGHRGEIKGFTGIDDPYEEPLNPEIWLKTTDCSPEDNARKIIKCLVDQGFLK
ncbi:MAG: adenylyl-sulfate kinase [Deltaproteobacteria bacterium]|nr:adenylyl-sulfate kinase [Deltaproteobacteria bacterium]